MVIKKDVVQSDDEDFYGFEMPETEYNLKNAVVSLSKLGKEYMHIYTNDI